MVCNSVVIMFWCFSLAGRVSYCTVDPYYDKVFCYISRNHENKKLECHAFLCSKKSKVREEDYSVLQISTLSLSLPPSLLSPPRLKPLPWQWLRPSTLPLSGGSRTRRRRQLASNNSNNKSNREEVRGRRTPQPRQKLLMVELRQQLQKIRHKL